MTERLVLVAIGLAAISGLPSVVSNRRSMLGQWATTLLAVAGGGLGIAALVVFWSQGDSQPIVVPWNLPGAEFSVAVDGLSALFLLPIFLISLLGSVYGLGYWSQREHPDNGRKLRLFYGWLTAGMALLVVARNGILFLFGWEIMALSAFFLVSTEDESQDVREAGWIYLVATHVATLCLFALFALWHAATGSFAIAPLADDAASSGMRAAMFALALAGFGVKAGIMPLHVWLPSSHTVAPSHVSAIMSGVIIKMGIYGLFRFTALLPTPPVEWGAIVLTLGAISGVLGVAFAIGQHDIKRLLAYHSIENIGIILLGLGLAMIGRSLDRMDLVILGLSGGLLHVWNHAMFKALLFLSAGSVIHAAHTRDIDRLGGLGKKMPWTSFCFLVGAVAICGLPPLNGFVSEFLIYLGLFGTLGPEGQASYFGAAFGAAALALIGALAVACFVKVYGVTFLGTARTAEAGEAHESTATMILSMLVLVGCCFFIGLGSPLLAGVLGSAIVAWAPNLADAAPQLVALAPLDWITTMAFALLAVLAVGGIVLWLRTAAGGTARSVTWGCGYPAATPRIQYTSSSFGQMLVGLFAWALRPHVHRPMPMPLFPQTAAFESEVDDTVLEGAVWPTFRFGARLFSWLRVFQQGSIQVYLLYIFAALIALLLWP